MRTYSERTFRRLWRQAVEQVLDWFIFSDEPAPQTWRQFDPWKQILEKLEKDLTV